MHPESQRLLLREFELSDWPAVQAYTSDREVGKFMPSGPTMEEEARRRLSQCMLAAGEEPRRICELDVVLRAEIVGYVFVHEPVHTVVHNRSREICQRAPAILPEYKERCRWLRRSGRPFMVK